MFFVRVEVSAFVPAEGSVVVAMVVVWRWRGERGGC